MSSKQPQSVRDAWLRKLTEAVATGSSVGSRRRWPGGPADPRRSAAGATAQVERWKDGTAKDPLIRLEEELDFERFAADGEYQGRPDIAKKMSRYLELKKERAASGPPVGSVTISKEDARSLQQQLDRDRAEKDLAAVQSRLAALDQDEPRSTDEPAG